MFLNSSILASLRFFEASARLLSFKAAALELHITQGAVSQQIKHLEEALGCKLFYRLPHQIRLTESGQQFAAVVQHALQLIEKEAHAIAESRTAMDIRLRVGPSLALRWLVPRMGSLYAKHPNIKLYINAAHGHFDPARREFDLAIELVKGSHPGFHSEFLMDEYLVPVCTSMYLSQHPLKSPGDLANCNLLHDGDPWEGASEDAEWNHWLREAGTPLVDSKRGQFFSLAYMAVEAALTHQGIAMGRLSLIHDLVESGELTTPFEQKVKSPARYCLLYPKEIAKQPGMHVVIQWLHEQVKATAG